MTYLLLQTFLLLLASYFLGAFVACTVKRALLSSRGEAPERVLAPVQADVPVGPPIVIPPQPVRPRPAQPMPPVTPRTIDPVQPKIEVLRRPEPRPAPAVLDPSRFERALTGPHFNEGVPRIAVIEICPAVLPPVTDIYQPAPPELPPPPPVEELPPDVPDIEDIHEEAQEPEPEPTPEPESVSEPAPEREPRTGGLAARLRDATTAAAAGAVAAAKAAAAASVAMPGMGLSRREPVKEPPVEETRPPIEEIGAEPVMTEPDQTDAPDADRDEAAKPSEEIVAAAAEPPAVVAEEETFAAEEEQEPALEAEPEAEAQPQSDDETPSELEPEIEPALEPEPEPELAREPEPTPESVPEPVVPAALIEDGDDFQRIRAIDSDIEQKLKTRGVVYFEHIAGWSASDVRRIGQELEMPGRIDREQWVEQAQILAKGGETYYSRNRRAMLKAKAETEAASETKAEPSSTGGPPASQDDAAAPAQSQPTTGTVSQREGLSGVAAASQGRSVAEMAAAAAAAIAASSASVTRGLKPIEPISPLSKVDPKISMPARITDAIREKGTSTATVEIAKDSTPLPEATAEGPYDDLKRIRGIGVLIEKRLNAMGIRRYDQIANWTSGDIDRVSRMLEFKGRIERESWVEQARILASGGYTEFSRRVDRGEVDTSRET
ncbi:hypothetical protein [Hyphomicrobium sp. 802]|uniref:hypothetical protein n=1 Tax=Hyphomicrobium sp. 802 TaxID=1112272 RepID=UPI00045E9E2A|nr:hypothetical protein [Hyphomicrobium sp. 802]